MLSRRRYLTLLTGSTAIVALVHAGSAAGARPKENTPPQKISKETEGYQDYLNGAATCGMCQLHIPPGGKPGAGAMGGGGMGMMGGGHTSMMQPGNCKLVAGSITPMGWRSLQTPTGAHSG